MSITNSQRIRNILNGDVTKSTKIVAGYSKKNEEHNDGDEWLDGDGKTWTIKNGIKQNVTKLDKIRSSINIPYVCPKCKRPMNKRLDKKFYLLRESCFDCVIEEDNTRIAEGTFKEYSKEIITKNVNSFVIDLKQELNEYANGAGSKHFISEHGEVEDWIGGKTKEELTKIYDSKLEKLDTMINETLKTE